MSRFVQLISGVPWNVDVPGFGTPYDESVVLGSNTTTFTLPLSQTYTPGQNQLEVFVNGIAQDVGIDFTEINTTQIAFGSTVTAGSIIRVRRE